MQSQFTIPSLKKIYAGKVRDLYEVDDQHMLIVASDRLSAFDVVLPTSIPGKGEVLTQISNFWFDMFQPLINNHLSSIPLSDIIDDSTLRTQLEKRTVVVKKFRALPVEAIVRGYIIGSGWKDYQQCGTICGNQLPAGLKLAERLPKPIYTPSTKASSGDHDMNISYDETVQLLGQELAEKVRNVSLEIYTRAAQYAIEKGIIIADTKFEFGLDDNDELYLIDEVLTPDSSRFWPANEYKVGASPASYDKQFIRDYLETLDWDKNSPGPELPDHIVAQSVEKYRQALEKLVS